MICTVSLCHTSEKVLQDKPSTIHLSFEVSEWGAGAGAGEGAGEDSGSQGMEQLPHKEAGKAETQLPFGEEAAEQGYD